MLFRAMTHSFSTHISWGSKHDPIMFKNICLVLPGSSNILGAQYTWKTNLTLPNRLRASKMVQWGKASGAKQGKERSATHGTQLWQKTVRQMEAGGRELASPDCLLCWHSHPNTCDPTRLACSFLSSCFRCYSSTVLTTLPSLQA